MAAERPSCSRAEAVVTRGTAPRNTRYCSSRLPGNLFAEWKPTNAEAALEEAQGEVQVLQGRQHEGVGQVPRRSPRPQARRAHPPGHAAERGGAAARVRRAHLPRLRRRRPLREQGRVPGLQVRLLHGRLSRGPINIQVFTCVR